MAWAKECFPHKDTNRTVTHNINKYATKYELCSTTKKLYVEKDDCSFAIQTVSPQTWIWRFSLIKRGGLHQTSAPRVTHFRSQTCPSQHLAYFAIFINKTRLGFMCRWIWYEWIIPTSHHGALWTRLRFSSAKSK